LCGFRPLEQTARVLNALGLTELAERVDSEPLADVFGWLVTRGDGVAALVDQVAALAASADPTLSKTKEIPAETAAASAETGESGRDSFVLGAAVDAALDTVRMLAAEYPGDPGIVVSLLLNRVTLRRGEALYLPAGNIHAYLSGLGIELMTASDNVLRGGLTTKHVDIAELLNVLDFTPTEVPYLRPTVSDGVELYRPDGPEFQLLHVTGATTQTVTGPAIALCTAGEMTISGAAGRTTVGRGDAVYITPDEAALTFAGAGEVFLATTS
jgi:mannose-6-phosphate isomerase